MYCVLLMLSVLCRISYLGWCWYKLAFTFPVKVEVELFGIKFLKRRHSSIIFKSLTSNKKSLELLNYKTDRALREPKQFSCLAICLQRKREQLWNSDSMLDPKCLLELKYDNGQNISTRIQPVQQVSFSIDNILPSWCKSLFFRSRSQKRGERVVPNCSSPHTKKSPRPYQKSHPNYWWYDKSL